MNENLERQIKEADAALSRQVSRETAAKAGCSCAGCASTEEAEVDLDALRIWQVKEEKTELEAMIKAAFERFTAKTGFAVTYIDVDVDTEDYPLPSYEEIKVTIQL